MSFSYDAVRPALQPARSLVQEIDPAHHRAPDRHLRLVGCLGIDDVAGGRIARPPRQAVATSHLAARELALDRLGRAEGRRARPHVDVRGERPVDHRRSGPDDLGEGDHEQRLGVLLGDRAGERHRAHRPGQRERRRHDRLAVGRHLHQPVAHRPVEPERRIRVDDRHRRRLADERVAVDAADDLVDLQGVVDLAGAEAEALPRLVEFRREDAVLAQVTDRHRPVVRLERAATLLVDDVERTDEAHVADEVLAVARPSTAVEVGHEGRAADRREDEAPAAEVDVPLRVPGMQPERRGRLADEFLDLGRGRAGRVACRGRPIAPARARASSARSPRTSTPISDRIRSDARWIASTWSADRISTGRNGLVRRRHGSWRIPGAARRGRRRCASGLAAASAAVSSSRLMLRAPVRRRARRSCPRHARTTHGLSWPSQRRPAIDGTTRPPPPPGGSRAPCRRLRRDEPARHRGRPAPRQACSSACSRTTVTSSRSPRTARPGSSSPRTARGSSASSSTSVSRT